MPDRVERREDLDTRERVQEVLFAVVQDRKRTKRHIAFVEAALAVMGLVLIATAVAIAGIPGTGVVGLIGENRERTDQAARLVDQIQSERERNIRAACESDNAQAERQERALTRFKADDDTRAFVRAILPQKKDCDVVVRRQIPSATEKTTAASEAPR